MNLLRTTHKPSLATTHPVTLEVSHLKPMTVDLLYSFIEIWLRKNCKSPWSLEQIQELKGEDHKNHIYLRIKFSDVREALYFKLSPSFLHSRSTLPLNMMISKDLFLLS